MVLPGGTHRASEFFCPHPIDLPTRPKDKNTILPRSSFSAHDTVTNIPEHQIFVSLQWISPTAPARPFNAKAHWSKSKDTVLGGNDRYSIQEFDLHLTRRSKCAAADPVARRGPETFAAQRKDT